MYSIDLKFLWFKQRALNHILGMNFWIIALFLFSACQNTNIIGARPDPDLITVVEAYLQQYQPGPSPRLFQTTSVYDRNGRLIAEYFPEGRRTWVSLEQISPHLINATIATEDATFYSNIGIDLKRLAGSVLQNAEAGSIVTGASTITMQLARNLFIGVDERYSTTLNRKTAEINIAQELTRLYSKDEILEMYLNLLNYGNLAYGPEAAAQVYFNKSAADLTLAEATLLAGLPQQPARLNPFLDFDAARQRQDIVLSLMVRHNFLDAAEIDAVNVEQEILKTYFADTQFQDSHRQTPNLAPHFTQYVIAQLDEKLGADYAQRAGLHIFTTLELELQNLAQQIVSQKVAELGPRYNLSNASLVAMKPGTNEILVMVGSADYGNVAISGQLNVALRKRQPGSTIKPLLYSIALDQNLISPATVLWDIPVRYTIDRVQTYRPRNYDQKFHGPVTVRTALANSYNVPVVKLFDMVGKERMLNGMRRLGIQSLTRENTQYGLSSALGSNEVTLLELSTAFHTLANEGQYMPEQSILTVLDSQGHNVEWQGVPSPNQIISPEAAFLVTDILSDNVARQPMFGLNSRLKLSWPAAAKTGTTTNWRDNWTIGYTRYLLAGVWAGNSNGAPMRNSTGASSAAPIWNTFMESVLSNPHFLNILDIPNLETAAWQFNPPPGLEKRDVCPPGLSCRAGGEYFTQHWLQISGTIGPLSDSVAVGIPVSVHVDRGRGSQNVGSCLLVEEGGQSQNTGRMLLQLPVPLHKRTGTTQEIVESDQDPSAWREKARKELGEIREWSRAYGIPITLGDCNRVDETVRLLYGDNVQNIALYRDNRQIVVRPPDQEATDEANSTGGEAIDDKGVEEDIVEESPDDTLQISNANQPVLYGLASTAHNTDCPGSYIMGQVVNLNGGPTAGIRIAAVDQWGNRAETVSKSSALNSGSFDFPIYSSTPHDIFVNIIDGAGNPISSTVVIHHNKSQTNNLPCHHVVFQGG